MITVTETAREHLKTILISNTVDPEVGLRLVFSGPGVLSLMLDKEKSGDQVVEHEESKVLLVDEEMGGRVGNVTIDFQDDEAGARLVIVPA